MKVHENFFYFRSRTNLLNGWISEQNSLSGEIISGEFQIETFPYV